ncbi:S4 domain-containing protein, partial [Acinetobacter baumannii]
MRLDKFIAQQLGVSRAIAGREIRGSRVTVDGDIVKDASFKLQPEHEVEYDGNTLTQQNGPRYFMLNKPQGYVCSTDDP